MFINTLVGGAGKFGGGVKKVLMLQKGGVKKVFNFQKGGVKKVSNPKEGGGQKSSNIHRFSKFSRSFAPDPFLK